MPPISLHHSAFMQGTMRTIPIASQSLHCYSCVMSKLGPTAGPQNPARSSATTGAGCPKLRFYKKTFSLLRVAILRHFQWTLLWTRDHGPIHRTVSVTNLLYLTTTAS
ncbi:hypothetical protein M758_4G033100 [Ceratodon purpureus]|nr:hypothetical protein M758_4G033100 [Ceratodon purpureus]